MTEGTPEDEPIALRGDPKNAGPVVPRRMIGALAGDRGTATLAISGGRLELARRMSDPANPLTARVAVNRVWHHLFGRGLVPSVDNFGALDDRPSPRSCSTTSPIDSSGAAGRRNDWCASWS